MHASRHARVLIAVLMLLGGSAPALSQSSTSKPPSNQGMTPPTPIPGPPQRLDELPSGLPQFSGSIGMLLHIAKDGRVKGCAITSSSGHPQIDKLACNGALQTRFKPARGPDGTAIESMYATSVYMSSDG